MLTLIGYSYCSFCFQCETSEKTKYCMQMLIPNDVNVNSACAVLIKLVNRSGKKFKTDGNLQIVLFSMDMFVR